MLPCINRNSNLDIKIQIVVKDFKKFQAKAKKPTKIAPDEALNEILISSSSEWIALGQLFFLNELASGKIIYSGSSILLPLTNEMSMKFFFTR